MIFLIGVPEKEQSKELDLPADSIIWRSKMEKDFIDEFIPSKDTRAFITISATERRRNGGYYENIFR